MRSSAVPTHREGCAGLEVLEVPSIDSLTNDDEYDVADDNREVEPRNEEASVASAAVACPCEPETLSDKIFRLNQPPRTDVSTTINEQTANVLMTSLKDRLPEVDVDRTLNGGRSENSDSDVIQGEVNVCGDLSVSDESLSDRQEIARCAVTGFIAGRPKVKITTVSSDCTDIMATCGRRTHSAEVKEYASTSMELKTSSTHRKSVKKRSRSAEDCASARHLSIPRLVGQSKWISTAAVAKPLPASQSGSSILDQSIGGRSQVVGRVMAEKQRQATMKERRVARTMAVIMAAFVVCWLPFFAIYVLFPFCGDACSEAVGERFVTFIVWLGYINSTINPIIYTVFNIDFRRAFKSLLFSDRCCRRRAIR